MASYNINNRTTTMDTDDNETDIALEEAPHALLMATLADAKLVIDVIEKELLRRAIPAGKLI